MGRRRYERTTGLNLTAPYDAKVPGGLALLPNGSGTTADRFVGEIYSELQESQ